MINQTEYKKANITFLNLAALLKLVYQIERDPFK